MSEPAETVFPKIQELIGAIRNLRNEYNVDKKKAVSVSIATPGDSGEAIQTNREIIELLATCRLKDVRSDLSPIADAARAQAAGCEIFVEDLVNAETQANRQNKQCEDLQKQSQCFTWAACQRVLHGQGPAASGATDSGSVESC